MKLEGGPTLDSNSAIAYSRMKWTHLHYFSLVRSRNATVLRPSVVYTECIVVKQCVLEQKLLLTAYKKSYNMVPK